MKKLIKMVLKYLFSELQVTVTPSVEYNVRSYKIRRIIPFLLFIIVITSITGLSYMYKTYESNYITTSQRLKELKNVKEENMRLKEELYALTRDTTELKNSLRELKEDNTEIRELIEDEDSVADNNLEMDLKLSVFMDDDIYKRGLPMGGEFHLYYMDTEEIIDRMRFNLSEVKQKLPSEKNNLVDLEKSVKEYNSLKAATPTIWPVADNGEGYISSEFGWRKSPTTGKQAFHEGLDIGVWYNTPVMTTADGIITFAGWKSGYGWTIDVKHGFGFMTRYGHLKKIKVKKGQQVKRGQIIGLSGNSGRSTGPHLHYEVRVNNIPKNPRKYIGGGN